MNNKIFVKRPDYTQLSSIFMGKDIYFQWRGQKDLEFIIDYAEWFKFIKANMNFLQRRPLLTYKDLFLESTPKERRYRYFYYDIAWAQYIEVVQSSICNIDATMILPYAPNCDTISIEEINNSFKNVSMEEKQHELISFKNATTAYLDLKGQHESDSFSISYEYVSEWNQALLDVVLYLKLRAEGKLNNNYLNIVKG